MTENVSDRVISLPMCAELTRTEIERVCDIVLEFDARTRSSRP